MQRGMLSRPVGLLFLAPAIVFIAVFLIYPFFSILQMSFTNQTLVGANARNPQFVGFENYATLFDSEQWMRRGQMGYSLLLTVQFVIGSGIIGQAILGLFIAVMLQNRRGITREVVYTLAIAAWIIPDVVVAFAWFAYLAPDGTLNSLLSSIGINGPDWLFHYPMLSIILFNTWRGAAFSMLLFSSALSSIPPSQLETADVLGASSWQKFRDILLPQLTPYIVTDLLLITLWTFNTFTPYLLTGGGPTFQTDIISIFTYRIGLRFFEFGLGSAAAMVVMIINFAIAGIYLLVSRSRRVAA